tara:strand:+ start:130 stop:588 length:459 start_codon:yes stop_codon:yes gene_type:complete
MLMEWGNRVWRLVKVDQDDAVDHIDGGVAYWKDRSAWQVTADASDGEGLANGVAGGTHVALDVSTYSATRYVFIQVGGDQAAVAMSSTSTAISDPLSGHASTDNQLVRTAAGTASINNVVATALSADGSTTTDNGATLAQSSKVRWVVGALM